jgi:hypothetical protein
LLLFVHTREKRFTGQGRDGRRWVQRHLEFMFLLNVGLDLLYVAAGVYLFYLAGMEAPKTEMIYHSFAYALGL